MRKIIKKVFGIEAEMRWSNARYNLAVLLKIYLPAFTSGFKVPGIRRIRIETTSACNLRCVYCPTGTDYNSHKISRRTMSDEIFQSIIDQVKGIKTIEDAVFFLAGEPFVTKNFTEMVAKFLNETTIKRIEFVTNGMLVTEEICKKLAALPVDAASIQVSLDGRTPEENNKYRVGSDYEKVKNNVIMMRKMLPVKYSMAIANVIVPEPDSSPFYPPTPKHLLNDFKELLGGSFGPFELNSIYAQNSTNLDSSLFLDQGFKKVPAKLRRVCVYPFREVVVRYNGDVVLCCGDMKSDVVLGNVLQNSVLNLFNEQGFRKVRRQFIQHFFNHKSEIPGLCRSCVRMTGEILFRGKEE